MKYKVLQGFTDKYTGDACSVGDIIDISEDRAEEINRNMSYTNQTTVELVVEKKTTRKTKASE